jgi:phage-related protein
LNEFGLNLPDQYIHRIWGSKENLCELRIIFAGQQERVLFFTLVEGKFLLTNGFRKTTDKVPQSEIANADRSYYEYLRKKKEKEEKERGNLT